MEFRKDGFLEILYTCYEQSLVWDKLRIVLSKPQIRILRSKSVDCPSTHPHLIGWVHMYAD